MKLTVKIFLLLAAFVAPGPAGYASAAATSVAATPGKQKPTAGKPRTSADAKKRKRQTQQQIKKTEKELKAAEAELNRNLRKVSKLENDIARSTANSARLKARIDSLSEAALLVKDSIAAGEAELQRLRGLYTRAVRSSRKNRREMNVTTFIFSAQTFRQARRRMNYLKEFSTWRKRKALEINEVIKSLEKQRAALEEMKIKVSNLRRESLAEERRLRADKAELSSAVGALKGKQKELNTMLSRQQSQLLELDREIERLIRKEIEEQQRREAEEARKRAAAEAAAKAADKSDSSDKPAPAPAKPAKVNQSGNFAAQKGKLPSPLSHTYVIVQGFGIQKHHSVKTLEINNPGVDLETASGATARAVYPGVVSAVFRQDGLGHVVLIRHGEYLTVYANIATLKVAKGNKVKTGDVIGTVAQSDTNPDRGQLHFEIRHERQKINPMQWLKH